MIESDVEKQAVLDAFGQDLEFGNGTIKAITEIDVTILAGESTVYTVERQNFLFQCLLQDVVDNDIGEGDTFTITDGIYTYTMLLNRSPNVDLLGWCTLMADYVSKELV